jgi:short-subunit dehydrogenase involved in D-alanine esterification of teichoic acids
MVMRIFWEFSENCSMRVLPHLQDTGGFFIAVLEKVGPMMHEKKENTENKEKSEKSEEKKEEKVENEEKREKSEGKEEIPVEPEEKVKFPRNFH